MAIKKVYKVSFKGVILPGFDKDQVVENVHDITRIPKHTITRKFFSGKTVVIRHADSQEYASRLQKTFSQAGIETYIEDVTKKVSDDESPIIENIDSETESMAVEKEPVKSHLTTIIIATISSSVVIITMVILFFLNNDSQPKVEDISSQVNDSSISLTPATEKTKISDTKKTLPLQVTDNESSVTKLTLTPFLIEENIESLIKITDKSELKQLSQFISLLGIKASYFDSIKQAIYAKNSPFSISNKNPLYVFKTRALTDKIVEQAGILLSLKNKLPQSLLSQLKKEFNNIPVVIDVCTKKPDLKIVSTISHVLFTTNEDKQKLKNFKNLSEKKQLNFNLLQLDHLFHQINEKQKNVSFSFFYSDTRAHKQSTDKISTRDSNYIALSSNKDSFWLALDESSFTKNTDLFKELNVDINNAIKISSIKTNNLFDLILLVIVQSNPDSFFNRTEPASSINQEQSEQEQVITIKKIYSVRDIKPYQDELDIELRPQWKSGPFALTTNQFKYDKNLVIELLAKGQNIQNLMEYSHSAILQIDSVSDKNNINILKQNCLERPHIDQAPSESYFRDFDGEQEAYINDDFITYRTITAKNQINIKPGFNNNDIKKIAGKIILSLPEQIKQKIIKSQKNIQFFPFEQFSVLLRRYPKTNSLEYVVTGKIDQFITLRAYNSTGDVINTLSFKEKISKNKQIKSYQHEFSESIDVIKVFYTNKNKILDYPFTFKPEILPVTTSLSGPIGAQLLPQESEPIPFSPGKLEIKPLKNEIQNDNPAWLGQKWPNKDTFQETASPFYVNLFVHENKNDTINAAYEKPLTKLKKRDAVLNIKTSLSPFISQNITAVKLILSEDNNQLLNKFISFTTNEFIEEERLIEGISEGESDINDFIINNDEQIKTAGITSYLNANSAFEITALPYKDKNKVPQGLITLSLPTAFKIHSKKYDFLGQTIKSDGIFIKTIQLNKHQIQFEIRGKIKNLVQLKLYNTNNHLISEPFEFKHTENNRALLTLLYNDKIDTIKLVLSQDSIIKEYPFHFLNKSN